MPDFLRWIVAGISSLAVAVGIFLLATVGIVVALGVFLVMFVVIAIAMRRMKKNVQYAENGSRVIFYTNIPEGFTRQNPSGKPEVQPDEPNTYELSPEEYTVEPADGEDKDAGKTLVVRPKP